MNLHHVRRGSGEPVLLVHGLGGSWRSWGSVFDGLAAHREVIAVDLPGFGESPLPPGELSIDTLTVAVAGFVAEHDLDGVDLVGQSMGGRIVLELARRRIGGDVVALDPGGFWSDRELAVFRTSLGASIGLLRRLRPMLPALVGNPVARSALLAQLSPRPWALDPADVLPDLCGLADAPGTDPAFTALVRGPRQEGAAVGTVRGRLTLGWGRRDRVTFPRQARRAAALFPDAHLHWFDRCGHFPQWDAPQETVDLVLTRT
ncbi:alpha/beta fold hydrolase [Pseudonocardia saturnea]